MSLILAPTHLHNGFNEKGWKTNGTIGDEGVKKETPIHRNCVDIRDRDNVVTSYPEEDIISSVNSLELILRSEPRVTNRPQRTSITSSIRGDLEYG